ncbi:MAG: hypothetical protein FWF57_07090 [Defluviitaleaceae bacterium]|nr:hypothetical protein [Defluviitaleaceae bacterium]
MQLSYKNPNIPQTLISEINKYYIYAIIKQSVFIYSIIVLFFLEYNLTFTMIMILSSVESFGGMITNVPAGILADTWGRKKTTILGNIISAIGIALYIIYPVFIFFIFAELILVIGASSNHGAALMYSKFKKYGVDEHYIDYEAFKDSKLYIISSIIGITATIIYNQNIYLPFIMSIVALLLSNLYLFRLEEEKGTTEI